MESRFEPKLIVSIVKLPFLDTLPLYVHRRMVWFERN